MLKSPPFFDLLSTRISLVVSAGLALVSVADWLLGRVFSVDTVVSFCECMCLVGDDAVA